MKIIHLIIQGVLAHDHVSRSKIRYLHWVLFPVYAMRIVVRPVHNKVDWFLITIATLYILSLTGWMLFATSMQILESGKKNSDYDSWQLDFIIAFVALASLLGFDITNNSADNLPRFLTEGGVFFLVVLIFFLERCMLKKIPTSALREYKAQHFINLYLSSDNFEAIKSEVDSDLLTRRKQDLVPIVAHFLSLSTTDFENYLEELDLEHSAPGDKTQGFMVNFFDHKIKFKADNCRIATIQAVIALGLIGKWPSMQVVVISLDAVEEYITYRLLYRFDGGGEEEVEPIVSPPVESYRPELCEA